jgi:hypothetical protein
MAPRTLVRGSRGEDVRLLQQLLQQAGFDPGPIDGIFGARTENAVKGFQRERGLTQDGAVGPITWGALTAPLPAPGGARGRSLHIGLNIVDNAAYGAAVPPLRGCHNDARDMMRVAGAQGFRPSPILLDAAATAQAVIQAISEAAQDLRPGDCLFLTYSGHGSQMPDASGEEPDQLDETWVLYDRQLLDDELYALWGAFRPGVRILVLSDSCHSGTVTRDVILAYKAVNAAFEDTREGFVRQMPRGLPLPATRDVAGLTQLQRSLEDIMPSVVEQLHGQERVTIRSVEVDRYVEMVLAQLEDDTRGVVLDEAPITRNLPSDIAVEDASARRGDYSDAKRQVRESAPPQASVLLISGCQDNQLSLDGARNGLFTQRLLETWANGAFAGNYPEFHRQIVACMPPQQTPNLFWTPATPDRRFEQQRPFSI